MCSDFNSKNSGNFINIKNSNVKEWDIFTNVRILFVNINIKYVILFKNFKSVIKKFLNTYFDYILCIFNIFIHHIFINNFYINIYII